MTRKQAIASLFSLSLVLAPMTQMSATSYVMVSDAALADQADLIVRGEVEESWVSSASGKVMTHYHVAVEEVLKGDVPGSGLEIRVLGGVDLEERQVLKVWGMPSFRAGESALLFLRGNDDGSYHVLHMLLGAFHLRGGLAARALDEDHVFSVSTEEGRSSARQQRETERFSSWLADRARGVRREADYWADPPQQQSFRAAFTNLTGDDNLVIRWFRFDEGKRVKLKRHVDGHQGVPTLGKNQFRVAVKAWNDLLTLPGDGLIAADGATEPRIRLKRKGKTTQIGIFAFPDGINGIYGRDFNDDIEEDFDCDEGGVLAIGGISWIDGSTEWKERDAFVSDEIEIIINDNTECFYASEGRWENVVTPVEEVYTHELGHTLGLGHSCGDDFSPSCSKSDVLDRATMRARAHGDGRAGLLAQDDVAAVWFLYSPDETTPVPCSLRVPGASSFCTKCGPCGVGQGNCKRSSQCLGELVCAVNVGADFGFSPTTNVCVAD